jgi:glycogen operon protein
VQTTRERVKRAMLATLMLSHGTPMLLGGDEWGRTQHGNNNPYAQDSELSWFDWSQALSVAGSAQRAYVTRLIRVRREFSSLRSDYYQHGRIEPLPQVRDIEWFDESGDVMRPEDWHYGDGRLLCLRRALRLDEARVEVSLLLTNNTPDSHSFQLPDPRFRWSLRLDSADVRSAEQEIELAVIDVAAHSLQLLTAIVPAAPAGSLTPPLIHKATSSEAATPATEGGTASAVGVSAEH